MKVRAFAGAAFAVLLMMPSSASAAVAHRDGCHRWHSCPSDSGSYVCGDLGYDSECPKEDSTADVQAELDRQAAERAAAQRAAAQRAAAAAAARRAAATRAAAQRAAAERAAAEQAAAESAAAEQAAADQAAAEQAAADKATEDTPQVKTQKTSQSDEDNPATGFVILAALGGGGWWALRRRKAKRTGAGA